MRPKRLVKHSQAGFTLLEVQIAMVLLVLIMGLLFGALHLAAKSWQAGQGQNELIEQKRMVAEFLRRQIGQITPIIYTNPRGNDLIFRGKSDAILFVAKLPSNRNEDELSLMQLITRDDGSKKRLELGYAKLSPDQTPFDTRNDRMKHSPVLDNIKHIEFQYFGRQKPGTSPLKWTKDWTSKRLLPQLIRCNITLIVDQKNGQQVEEKWSEMTFPLHVHTGSGFRQFTLQESPRNNSSSSNSSISEDDHEVDIEELF